MTFDQVRRQQGELGPECFHVFQTFLDDSRDSFRGFAIQAGYSEKDFFVVGGIFPTITDGSVDRGPMDART
jgi:hypothetical protein